MKEVDSMKHIHVAALEGDAELAKKMGKKGSESDFTIYNCKEGDSVICLYHAARYPEKIQPLIYALALCDAAYLRPQAIDKFTGEMIVACAVFGRKLFVIADRVSKEEMLPLLKAAGIENYEFFEGDEIALREKLLSLESMKKKEGKTEVLIDSCFPVKGVGTVALGIALQGVSRVHQKLSFVLSGADAEIKSIQVQDEDVKEAEASSRVGFCLKGIEPEKVEKGDIAAEERFPPLAKFEGEVALSKFYKGSIEAVQFFVLCGLRFSASKAKKLQNGNYELEMGAPLPLRAGETAYLFLPEAMPRVIGKVKVSKVLG